MRKSKQNAQESQEKSPKEAEIETKKAIFLEALRDSCGNVSKALIKARLNRRTAYDHRLKDHAFADAWQEVLEIASDEILSEIRRRAMGYEYTRNGRKFYKKANTRLLIHLDKQFAAKTRMRHQMMVLAKASLEAVLKEGRKAGLTNDQILAVRNAIRKVYGEVSYLSHFYQ